MINYNKRSPSAGLIMGALAEPERAEWRAGGRAGGRTEGRKEAKFGLSAGFSGQKFLKSINFCAVAKHKLTVTNASGEREEPAEAASGDEESNLGVEVWTKVE